MQSTIRLPIAPHLLAIRNAIAGNAITTVISPTGTGKSIGIPWIVASANTRIFVAVPTITAALSLHRYFARSFPHIKTGYAAESEVHYDDSTMVVYATSGHIRRKILELFRSAEHPAIAFCDVLMVDEVHMGTLDNYIILGLWYYCGKQGSRVPRLVLSSATVEEGQLTGVVYRVPEEAYPTDVIYHDKNFVGDKRRGKGNPRNDLLRETAEVVNRLHGSSSPGHFLVFVAGSSDVEELTRTLSNIGESALVLPAYGRLEGDDLALIYEDPPKGVRKIIVATNVAEASITIGGVVAVIDTLQEKRMESSLSGGPRLVLTSISRASADQRKGRAGRTGPGLCYRMCTKEAFASLEATRPPEILRIPLHGAVIELLDVGLDPLEILPALTGTRLNETILLLRTLGMTAPRDQGKEEVTDIGRFAARIPFGVRNSATLWWWIQARHPVFPGIVVMALVDSYDSTLWRYPRRDPKQTVSERSNIRADYKKKYFRPFAGRSDVHTLLNLWNSLMSLMGGPDGKFATMRKWAKEHSIRLTKISEMVKTVRRTSAIVRRAQVAVDYAPFTVEGVVKALRPLVERTYSDLLCELAFDGRRPTYYRRQTKTRYILDNVDAINDLQLNPPLVIAALIAREIASERSVIRVISLALDIQDTTPDFVRTVTSLPVRSSRVEDVADLTATLARLSSYLGSPSSENATSTK